MRQFVVVNAGTSPIIVRGPFPLGGICIFSRGCSVKRSFRRSVFFDVFHVQLFVGATKRNFHFTAIHVIVIDVSIRVPLPTRSITGCAVRSCRHGFFAAQCGYMFPFVRIGGCIVRQAVKINVDVKRKKYIKKQ